jgi:hypothetical protein
MPTQNHRNILYNNNLTINTTYTKPTQSLHYAYTIPTCFYGKSVKRWAFVGFVKGGRTDRDRHLQGFCLIIASKFSRELKREIRADDCKD